MQRVEISIIGAKLGKNVRGVHTFAWITIKFGTHDLSTEENDGTQGIQIPAPRQTTIFRRSPIMGAYYLVKSIHNPCVIWSYSIETFRAL